MSDKQLNIRIISAGAGSGKTFRLTKEMVELLQSGVRASGIIATTFTNKAAAELQERVRVKLLEEGMTNQANELSNALIGTVHSLGVKLLQRFAFEAGVSPQVNIIADEDHQVLFNKSLATVLTNERIKVMEHYSDRLGLNKRERYDWRREVKYLTDTARANDFSLEVLEKSKVLSFESFQQFLRPLSKKSGEDLNKSLFNLLEETITRLENNEDETKKTRSVVNVLKSFLNASQLREELYWYEWAKISKIDVGSKSKDDVEDLKEFAQLHDTHPDFQKDIQQFIYQIFEIAIQALEEYEQYKKQRGLIDYVDMEIHVKRLLMQPHVQEVLREEIDLLMVDEFQDTSPIQLEIFLQLSRIAKHSIWVGDPKQSIYGFRGADPKLMQAIIEKTGGVNPADIQKDSWRSREDIVFATNAIFTKAFPDLKAEHVALNPKRKKEGDPNGPYFDKEPIEVSDALVHWYFNYDGEGKRLPGKPWMENCIARSIKEMIESDTYIFPKDGDGYRPAIAGDFAVLCRSNAECQTMAEALHRSGLKAAISRNGLLNTAETRLILACLKYILNKSDSLSKAEILLLASEKNIESIIDTRLTFLAEREEKRPLKGWEDEDKIINQLNELRLDTVELSSAEMLNWLMEELDLRRIIASWGNEQQRLDNVDVLRKFALQYEEACNRLHTAASLGGFLLWLNEKVVNDSDAQGSGEGEDAVNVLTYHRSKGLEWPVVICHSLEGNLRESVWGMAIISEQEEIDLDHILANRWLRYWINPYADQYRRTIMEDRINESEAKKIVREQALAEEARLLYVGITRARDYLVFPTRAMTTKWLNRVYSKNESLPTLDAGSFETPWEWEGKFLNIHNDQKNFPRDFEHIDASEKEVLFIEERNGKSFNPPYLIDLSIEGFEEIKTKVSTSLITYNIGINIAEEVDKNALAKTVGAFLTADRITYPQADRMSMVQKIVERHELLGQLDEQQLLQLSTSFYSYLDQQFLIKKQYRKYAVQFHRNGRLFESIIDLVLETEQGLILIEHNIMTGTSKNLIAKANELGQHLFFCKKGLENNLGIESIQTFVHFCFEGCLIDVMTHEVQTA